MSLRVLFLVIVSLGGTQGRSWKKEENKPNSIKTIQSKTGQVYDCIDIYKQPAFNHPLLKNHTLQLKPSSLPNGLKPPKPKPVTFYGFNDTCPSGTIPIERSQKPDNYFLSGSQKPDNYFLSGSINDDAAPKGHYYAIIETIGSDSKFYGASALMTIHEHPNLLPNQVTSSTIYVYGGVNGPDNELNVIQAGWHITPAVYNDNVPRFFVYWTNDGHQNTGCINLRCIAFVGTSSRPGPGSTLSDFSVYNGEEKFISVQIFKDPSTSNWWVSLQGETIGYYPKELLPKMEGGSDAVQMGGHVFSSFTDPSPPMGSDHPYNEGRNRAAYFTRVQVADSKNRFYNLAPESLRFIADIPDYYGVGDYHFANSNDGYVFAYGGAGGFTK